MNDEMMMQVNGGSFFPNTYSDARFRSVGVVEIRTHFWDPDEFVMEDGRIIHMREANELVRAQYPKLPKHVTKPMH